MLVTTRLAKALAARGLALGLALVSSHAGAQLTAANGEKLAFSLTEFKVSGAAPTVILSHGGNCVTSSDTDWGRQINQWGYHAVLIDHCTQRGVRPHTGEEPPPLSPLQRVNDAVYTAEWVRKQGWHQGGIILMGFSRGGEAVLRAADPRMTYNVHREAEGLALFDGYVAYYPACSLRPLQARAPLMIHHGELDNLASFSQCEYTRMTDSNFRIHTYPGVHHGFDSPGAQIAGANRFIGRYIARSYDASADQKSRQLTREFLQQVLRFPR